jgi:integrase
MASISRDPGGRRRILFIGADGQRRAVRLGKVPQRVADSVCARVEALAAAAVSKTPWDSELAAWVGGLDSVLYGKLAAVALVPKRDPAPEAGAVVTLGAFLDAYFNAKTFSKPNTQRNYEVTRGHLLHYFGANRPLADISAGCADEWRENLLGKLGLSAATVSREVKRARQFFRAAVRKRLIPENPFTDLPTPQQVNKDREFYVTRDVTERVLAACPDAEWRLIVALSRYGGLRCPSETLALQLGDVDWANNRFTVRSPKTEHHPNGATRVVPLFPELRPFLEAVFDAAPEKTVYFVNRYRDKNANLRTQFERIIKRAGAEPWPRLFHNLRASRETELAAEHPLHVVCAWIGNSAPVAAKHYLQVTDADFKRAAGRGAESGALSEKTAAQNPAQPVSATICHDGPRNRNANAGLNLRPTLANRGQPWLAENTPPRGNELSGFSQGSAGVLVSGGAESGALWRDSDLAAHLAQWLDGCPVALSDETKAGILAMVRTASGA